MGGVKQRTEDLRKIFQGKSIDQKEDEIEMQHFNFHSNFENTPSLNGLFSGDLFFHELVDCVFSENFDFTYPVILPKGKQQFSKGIILMHGLNEKSWDKYLAWGSELALKMNCPVILFPLAYHMNRAPVKWSDPRQMKDVVILRNQTNDKCESTFANVALSTRLSTKPEQFIYSGVQSYYDICDLMDSIHNGNHPLFSSNAKIDFFAYSIGAFLAQILFIGNSNHRFEQSRLFIFAGGPTFDTMMGTSRYIMDLKAFKSLLTLKKKRVLKKVYRNLSESSLPNFEVCWRSFYAMLHCRKGRKIRNEWLQERGDMVNVIALKNDRVMPEKSIIKTFNADRKNTKVRIDVIDFPFSYTHENPFPMNDDKIQTLVDRSFNVVFEKATRFFMQAHPTKRITESRLVQSDYQVSLA